MIRISAYGGIYYGSDVHAIPPSAECQPLLFKAAVFFEVYFLRLV